ncbi:CPBP family intramembrane glutamic endopeptidase [Neobacillus sp. DY30]|uniref:CPBP family intramembrane glutamic endopeptidase n=1 Tax=Neobacillus sp. DY30 TaxID=3047871 RepID=UPI0024C06018|nr:CPBP family intramembrane glutamic endopeptidase [Neobacillus sp. DY30]WHX98278.1 CPBP family intramembrane metalloprotease [Neobacillus sp. DY30]
MKQNYYQGNFLSLLFIVLVYLFTRNHYSPFFWMILGLLLVLSFLREENRLFAWVIISFFGSNLIVIYLDKFIDGLIENPFYLVLVNQILFIIPTLTMCYVIKQFHKRISFYFNKPKSFRIFFSYLLLIAAGFLFLFFIKGRIDVFLALFTFSLIHAIVQEVIWRGILLTQMIKIMSEKTAILYTSIAFSVNTTIFGFGPSVVLLYLTFGLIFGFLTTKFTSIFPAIGVHTLVLLSAFLIGWIQLPIL